jgi:hypothetical protein
MGYELKEIEMANPKGGIPPKSKGRPAGSVNRTTRDSRAAIASFVDGNIPKFTRWLDQVSEGIPQYDGAGNVIVDERGSVVWLVKPDPLAAIKVVGDLTEYHLPKLSRQDITTRLLDPSEVTNADQLTDSQIMQLLVQRQSITVEGELVEPATAVESEPIMSTIPIVDKG